jgi:hypothetical protein
LNPNCNNGKSIIINDNVITCAIVCEKWRDKAIIDYEVINYNNIIVTIDNYNVDNIKLAWGLIIGESEIYLSDYEMVGESVNFVDNGTNATFMINQSLLTFIQTLPIFYNGENIKLKLYSTDEYGRKYGSNIKYNISYII